jgi:hypothetical protein
MTPWFASLGLPLGDAERLEITGTVREHAGAPAVEVVLATGWWDVAKVLQATERDPRGWDREEEERERLWQLAAEEFGEWEVLASVRAVTDALSEVVHAAAARAASRHGAADAGLAREAAAAALLSAHQDALAALARAGDDHWFRRRHAWFARGRWPVGFSGERFVIF